MTVGGFAEGYGMASAYRKSDASVSLAGDAGMKGRDYRLSELWERADRAYREARDLVDDQRYIQSRSGFGA